MLEDGQNGTEGPSPGWVLQECPLASQEMLVIVSKA